MDVENSFDTPPEIKGMAIALIKLGFSYRDAELKFDEWRMTLSKSTIHRIYQRYLHDDEIDSRREQCGRQKLIGQKSKSKIVNAVLKNRRLTAADIARDPTLNTHQVTRQCIGKVLIEEGLNAYRPTILNSITEKNLRKRRKWCEERLHWTINDWRRIIFTDESLIQASSFQIKWVRKFEGEILDEEFCETKSRWNNGIRIMIWGGITFEGLQSLYFSFETINGDHYLEILNQCIDDFEDLVSGNRIFMQDNAPVHKKSIEFLNDMKIQILEWPAQSPDLNPIENIWAVVKDQIWKVKDQLNTKDQLMEKIEEIWWSDPIKKMCKNVYESMPNRVKQVYERNGNSCRY